ncbi:hypothetical protein PV08_08752 [Exophiala spinifera]|uniref:SnoaL-like domain-containing protein n=1 Tax=Exophiala spinifera TaxID=91928 RepID=A0A0D2BQX4_9EURO|nr:uncharacterized protein PV08_08752 [Exophiala spinifera]KIW13564.1 hypothetical protein PV08_08752 [Exophiala spinifera]
MGYNTAETEWPSSIELSEAKKDFLDKYFNLLDTNTPTAGAEVADLYTDDGYIMGHAGPVRGHAEIQKSRDNGWSVIKTRCHKLIRVYAFDSSATDLLIIGSAVQGLANGKSVSGEWAARICLDQGAEDSVKIKSHQVWADFGGVLKAIQEALGSS